MDQHKKDVNGWMDKRIGCHHNRRPGNLLQQPWVIRHVLPMSPPSLSQQVQRVDSPKASVILSHVDGWVGGGSGGGGSLMCKISLDSPLTIV